MRRPRFCLRTLLLFVCLMGSGFGLLQNSHGWRIRFKPEEKGVKIECFALSPDTRFVATGSDDCNIRIWDIQKQKLVQVYSDHAGPVGALAYSENGKWLISASYDSTARLWEVISGQCISTVSDVAPWNSLVAVSNNGVWLAAKENVGELEVWNIEQNTRMNAFHVDYYEFLVAIAENGETVSTIDQKGISRSYSVNTQPAKVVRRIDTGNPVARPPWYVTHSKLRDYRVTSDRGDTPKVQLWHRRRPEQWYGLAWLWEFWLTLAFGVGLAWSVWKDCNELGDCAMEALK